MAIIVISGPSDFGLVKNPIYFELKSDQANIREISLQVWIEHDLGSEIFVHGFEMVQPVDETGSCTFNINEHLIAFLSFSVPDVRNGAVQIISNHTKRYQIKYAEILDESLILVSDAYHEDLSNGAPHFLRYVVLDESLEIGSNYVIVSQTNDTGIVVNNQLRKDSNLQLLGAGSQIGLDVHQELNNASHEFNEIRIPANTRVVIYKNPITFEEPSNIYYACLAGVSKMFREHLPEAPGNVSIVPISETELQVKWVDNSGFETSFDIERSLSPGIGYATRGSVVSDAVSYNDSDLGFTIDTTYYYKVSARRGTASNPSGEVAFILKPWVMKGGNWNGLGQWFQQENWQSI